MKTVHIGEIIKKVAKEKRLTDEEISQGVNLSRTGVQRTYAEADMNTAKLRKFSEYLEYDFFAHLTEKVQSDTLNAHSEFQEPLEKYDKVDNQVSLVLTIPRAKQQQIMQLVFG